MHTILNIKKLYMVLLYPHKLQVVNASFYKAYVLMLGLVHNMLESN